MHVGHIRSTIIGESLSRLLKLNGHKVTKDNHLGDWGTQFGILLYAIKREGIDLDSLGDEPVAKLEDLYRMGNQWIKDDKQALEEARDELVKLQKGDEENLSLWQKIRDLSMDSFEQVYRLLGVSFDYAHGESFYRDQVKEVYTSLGQHNICQEDAGALVVFHPEHKRFAKQPFIIRKSDGASNYATTDLATLKFRAEEWQSDQIIYVTDGRQRDHFEQLFLTAQKWFSAESKNLPTLSHVWFGTILGEDNKAIKTRDGQPIKLVDLLAEAIRRASEMVKEKNPDLPEAEINRRAQVIGLGAVKYADLSQDRTLDYVFSWEKLLAMQGNTAPYLQYAVARVCSIFRKIEGDPEEFIDQAREPKTEAEKKLARKLIFFPLAIEQATRELKPHFLCTYLYELATEFSSFYNQDKVMVSEPEAQGLRLLLCKTTQTYLQTGLEMLGIETLEEM
jgi:arginyl-tRNA synthetase